MISEVRGTIMAAIAIFLAVGLACATANPAIPERIVGGSLTTISQYPSIVSMLQTNDGSSYWQSCGGTVINTRSILTAAHCTINHAPVTWRARVGSTFANSGGVVHSLATIINHPNYNSWTTDNDIAIVRTASNIGYVNNAVQPGSFAGANYNVPDNAVVWAAGWGRIAENGPTSEQLRHVQIWTVNQAVCRNRYGAWGTTITDNMLCSGWLDVGGRDQCSQDSGGPLYHNGVVVGVCSFGIGCGRPDLPGVNARVSRYAAWIQANA